MNDRDKSQDLRDPARPSASAGFTSTAGVSVRLPRIEQSEMVEVGYYSIEHLKVEFTNGIRRDFHRLHSQGYGSVIIAAIPEPGVVLLIREYSVGVHAYELGLPKGRMDKGESVEDAANRELKEEVGFGARRLTCLRTLSLAPTYMSNRTHLVLAEDLYEERLPGDEPEELEVVPWRLDQLGDLMLRDDCSEARSIAGLFMVREYLATR